MLSLGRRVYRQGVIIVAKALKKGHLHDLYGNSFRVGLKD